MIKRANYLAIMQNDLEKVLDTRSVCACESERGKRESTSCVRVFFLSKKNQ